MARVLVTGGAGFIGSHVAEELVGVGHQVWVVDDLSGGFTDNLPDGVRFVEGSILDEKLLGKLFTDYQFEYVFHLAAYAAEGLSHFIKRFNYQNNLIGSVNLINLAILHGVKCFVFTSSVAVYGENQVPMSETMRPEPADPYGIAKFAVEQELQVCLQMFGLPYIVFRPHNVYGERQNIGDKYRNVVGIFMNQAIQGNPMPVFGDGEQKRAFTYVGDVAPVIARSIDVAEAYNQVFNIGADIPYRVKDLALEVGKSLGLEPVIEYLEARNEVHEVYSDHSKAKRVLGAKAEVSLEDGVRRMARWVQAQGVRKSKDFENIEIPINLPAAWN